MKEILLKNLKQERGMCKCGHMIGFHFWSRDPIKMGLQAEVLVSNCSLCKCEFYNFNKVKGGIKEDDNSNMSGM